MVVLPPRLTITKGKIIGKTAAVLDDIADNYGKRLRMNRNMVLYLAPDSGYISGAIERAMDWLAANRVLSDSGLMARFSDAQKQMIQDKATTAANDTKDHVRKAYNTVILPCGPGQREVFELSYVPPSKTVLVQAAEELLSRGKIHKEFNPALLESRWASLWPRTATVITAAAMWEKFARQGEAPILTGVSVLQETIHQGVEREIFGYGIMHDSEQEKLKAASYERVFLGPHDASDLFTVEISNRTVLLRPDQVYALFPPITKEEVAMLLKGPRQSAEAVFEAARKSPGVQGRVDKRSFLMAICEGVKAGLFGYADSADGPIVRGAGADLAPDQVRLAGMLVGEDVPLPITADEIAQIVPVEGRLSVQNLYQQAIDSYGEERVSEQNFLHAMRHCIAEGRFGYADTETATIQIKPQAIGIDGFVAHPEALPPDTRIIRFNGAVSSVELANVIKAAINLSKLAESSITLDLRLELKGQPSDHAVQMALNELRSRVLGLRIEDVKGKS